MLKKIHLIPLLSLVSADDETSIERLEMEGIGGIEEEKKIQKKTRRGAAE